MAPHSKTVRGTLANPKTKNAIETKRNPTQLGDPVSLETEKNNSVPLNSMPDFSQPADPYRGNESRLPHSQTVRGTMANSSGSKVNKSMLGDPISLKAETSKSDLEKGTASSGDEEGLREAAERRGEYEKSRRSKL